MSKEKRKRQPKPVTSTVSRHASRTKADYTDGTELGYWLAPNGRITALKQGSGMYGAGYPQFIDGAIGPNIPLSFTPMGFAAAYTVSTWLYRCVEVRKQAVDRMPWKVVNVRRKNDAQQHPLFVAFKRNRQHLLRQVEQTQLLYGESFIELALNEFNYTSDLYWLNNLGMAVIIGVGRIMGYSYTALNGGMSQNFEPDQVAFMRTENPFNDLRGMSPVEVVLDEVAIDKDVARVVRSFYANDTRVGMLLIPKRDLNDADAKRFMDVWKMQNQGVNKAGKPVLVPQDLTVERAQTPPSLDDVELRESTRRDICAGLGVPLAIAGAWDDANYDSVDTQRKSFYEETVIPECDRIADFINTDIMPAFDQSGLYRFEFDYTATMALIEDAVQKTEIYSTRLTNGMITRAEARKAIGAEVRPEDDVFYIPTGVTVVPANQPAYVTPTANVVEDNPQEQLQTSEQINAPQERPQLPAQTQEQKPEPSQPEKAAKATGACYIILSLADNPAIKLVQDQLRAAWRGDMEWESPADFHVTLVHSATTPSEDVIKNVIPKSIFPFTLEVGGIGTFDTTNDKKPIYLEVKAPPALTALQAGLYGSWVSLGLDLSEYCVPTQWRPHITLGYAPLEAELPGYQGGFSGVSVASNKLMLSKDSGETFENLYTTVKTEIITDDLMLSELAAWQKKVSNKGAVKGAVFECRHLPSEIAEAVRAGLTGGANVRDLFNLARTAVKMVKDFDPSQQRDDSGRWSESGGGGGSSSGSGSGAQQPRDRIDNLINQLTPEQRQRLLQSLGQPSAPQPETPKPKPSKPVAIAKPSKPEQQQWEGRLDDDPEVHQAIQDATGKSVYDFVSASGGDQIPAKEFKNLKVRTGIEYHENGKPRVVTVSIGRNGDKVDMERHFSFDESGKPDHIYNAHFYLAKSQQGTGLGTKIFRSQTDEASKMGFKSIVTSAGRSKTMNGYYTWPRLGYDAQVDVNGKKTRLSDLMKTKEGRDYWKENGQSMEMEFDLSKRGRSRKILDAYYAERFKDQ